MNIVLSLMLGSIITFMLMVGAGKLDRWFVSRDRRNWLGDLTYLAAFITFCVLIAEVWVRAMN